MQRFTSAPRRTAPLALVRWFDSWAGGRDAGRDGHLTVDWVRILPFLALHVACFAVIWVGVSWTAVAVAVALYFFRMFAVTAFYHRYFSHRTFETSRAAQFVFAVMAGTCVQRGPLWWAAHHRTHHAKSDEPEDPHSPVQRGFWWSHVGWITARGNFATKIERVRDLAKFPELCWLDRFDIVVPVVSAAALYGFGALLGHFAPGLHTSGAQLLVWGIISTVVLFHAVFTINSLCHVWGRRVFATTDTSRNNFWLALLTLGEGWHNNHHHFPGAVRQGFRWWEIDVSYYVLRGLAALGIIWDLRPVPARVQAQRIPRSR
jgi:stearoyl-CoA desaturase (delta-9 desaturase)